MYLYNVAYLPLYLCKIGTPIILLLIIVQFDRRNLGPNIDHFAVSIIILINYTHFAVSISIREKARIPLSIGIGNVELVHECFRSTLTWEHKE